MDGRRWRETREEEEEEEDRQDHKPLGIYCTVAYNKRRRRKEERREKWSRGWMRRVWAVLTLD